MGNWKCSKCGGLNSDYQTVCLGCNTPRRGLRDGIKPAWESILIHEEKTLAFIMDLKLTLAFVPTGEPMEDISPSKFGGLVLTNRRLIVLWREERVKLYSTLGIYALSERFFNPSSPGWPYQAIIVLPGGLSLIVETTSRDNKSAAELSEFLNKALFSLGKRDNDIAGVIAMNAYMEEYVDRNRSNEITILDHNSTLNSIVATRTNAAQHRLITI